ncbi:YqcC family protein [Methylobacter sp. YRD-M1]|uniref:YqcC family protein n=1 Tax=Methylobacter sp. YRD-M1 TaxID=2911520 RepID=UPI00227B3179|nr:YqcC family protein [Methylobacter sp. YRD-M1]WAK00621.1 YqcC family protein [Methylobacter sp. YRD-M1]
MASDKYRKIAELLFQVEVQLLQLNYWQDAFPSSEALSSELPFSCDTLTFPQWLQFIFLPRMRALVECAAPLPTTCAIAPYAEEYLKHDANVQTLLAHLAEIDTLLTDL